MSGAPPLYVGVADLLHQPGLQRDVRVRATFDDLELSTVRVPPDDEVQVEVALEAQGVDMLTATGTVTASWIGECRRCLREIGGETTTQVQEVFERHPVEGETYPLDNDHVDLEPMVREAVLLALPLAPLCEAACRGPVPEQYPVALEDEEGPPPRDPRWAPLDQLTFDDEE